VSPPNLVGNALVVTHAPAVIWFDAEYGADGVSKAVAKRSATENRI
jgi:hypothetical protein